MERAERDLGMELFEVVDTKQPTPAKTRSNRGKLAGHTRADEVSDW